MVGSRHQVKCTVDGDWYFPEQMGVELDLVGVDLLYVGQTNVLMKNLMTTGNKFKAQPSCLSYMLAY